MHKTTYFLLVLIVITLSLSFVRRNHFFVEAQARQQPGNQKNARAERHEQAKRHFPIVEYDEPNLPDTEDNRAKKEKKKRFNELGNWVFANTGRRPALKHLNKVGRSSMKNAKQPAHGCNSAIP